MEIVDTILRGGGAPWQAHEGAGWPDPFGSVRSL
jgi:hypothetical protein